MPINVMQNDALWFFQRNPVTGHPDSDFCKCPTCDHLLPHDHHFNLIMLTVTADEKEFFNNLRMNN
jgi:hypothetical protein